MPASPFAPGTIFPLRLLLTGVIGLGIAGTVSLWVFYGTTVFFEMVRAGWIACF